MPKEIFGLEVGDWSGWAQAFFSTMAIFASVFLATKDSRAREKRELEEFKNGEIIEIMKILPILTDLKHHLSYASHTYLDGHREISGPYRSDLYMQSNKFPEYYYEPFYEISDKFTKIRPSISKEIILFEIKINKLKSVKMRAREQAKIDPLKNWEPEDITEIPSLSDLANEAEKIIHKLHGVISDLTAFRKN